MTQSSLNVLRGTLNNKLDRDCMGTSGNDNRIDNIELAVSDIARSREFL